MTLLAVLVNTAGGLVGGDRVASTITLGPESATNITTQAVEKIYRSADAVCRRAMSRARRPFGFGDAAGYAIIVVAGPKATDEIVEHG